MKKKSKWNGLEEHYKVATGPKTSTTRYNIFGLVAPANEESSKWNTCKWGPYCMCVIIAAAKKKKKKV